MSIVILIGAIWFISVTMNGGSTFDGDYENWTPKRFDDWGTKSRSGSTFSFLVYNASSHSKIVAHIKDYGTLSIQVGQGRLLCGVCRWKGSFHHVVLYKNEHENFAYHRFGLYGVLQRIPSKPQNGSSLSKRFTSANILSSDRIKVRPLDTNKIKRMKSVFYFSKKMWDYCQNSTNFPPTYSTIDGKQFNEHLVLADDAPVEPYNRWDDNILIAVVENVQLIDPLCLAADTSKFPLAGRVKYKWFVNALDNDVEVRIFVA